MLFTGIHCAYFPLTDITIEKGGNAIWGNHTHAPDDITGCSHTHGSFLSFRPSELVSERESHVGVEHGHELDHTTPSDVKNMTADEAGNWILEHTPDSFQVPTHLLCVCGHP